MKNWKRRWFVLEGKVLYYFHSDSDARTYFGSTSASSDSCQPLGKMVLDDAIISSAQRKTGKHWSLEVAWSDPSQRAYLIDCPDEGAFLGWMQALQDASEVRVTTTFIPKAPKLRFKVAGLCCPLCEKQVNAAFADPDVMGVGKVTVLMDKEEILVETAGADVVSIARILEERCGLIISEACTN